MYYRILNIKGLPLLLRKFLVVGSSWFFQSLLHVDKTERLFKLFIDVILIVPISYLLAASLSVPLFLSVSVAFIVGHTLNYLFNGQFFVASKNIGLKKTSTERFKRYARDLKKRIASEDSILAAAMFGSISRNELKMTSDLDVRIVRRGGLANGLKASVFLLKERSRAFIFRFPLDIYVADSLVWFRKKISPKEPPIILHDPDAALARAYTKVIDATAILAE